MSKQYHYIAMYDDETKEWTIDFDSSFNYDCGNVWDTEIEEWGFSDDEASDDSFIQDLQERLF